MGAIHVSGRAEKWNYSGRTSVLYHMRTGIGDKWRRMVDNSSNTDIIYERMPKVRKALVVKKRSKTITKAINQLISWHAYITGA